METPETITITKTCPLCGKDNAIVVMKDHYDRWIGGEYIQTAFPRLTPDEREAMITGIHAACWDKIFPNDDED